MTEPRDDSTLKLDESTVGMESAPYSPSTALAGEPVIAELSEAVAPSLHVIQRLGAGGMGVVLLARDTVLRRLTAIKILTPDLAADEAARARFIREAQAAAAISHPNVVSVYQVNTLAKSGSPYFVMQYIDGQSLGDRLSDGASLVESTCRRILGEVSAGLAAAHERGLVHRDIKPANIMLDRETGRAIVVDFGISAATRPDVFAEAGDLTGRGNYIGTPTYTSPEQAAGREIGAPSDVYSLGCVAFQLLTGRLPFQETTAMALLAAHIMSEPPDIVTLRPDIDRRFGALVNRCVLKDPGARPTAAEIANYLIPPPQPAVEWPPPGLELLRGAGARTISAIGQAVGWALLFLLLMTATPTRSTRAWYIAEQSTFWSWVQARIASLQSARAPLGSTVPGIDPTPIWLFLLACAGMLVLVTGVATIFRAVVLVRALRQGRDARYPWHVLADVAWDFRTDTAALMNGTGDFALMTRAQRERLLYYRRVQRRAMAATLLFVVTVAALWLTGALAVAEPREPVFIVSRESMLLVVIALTGALAVIASALPESRARAAGSGWRDLVRQRKWLAPGREIVAEWMRSARQHGDTSTTGSRTVPLVAGAALALASLLLVAIVTTVLLVTVSTTLSSVRSRNAAESWLTARRQGGVARPAREDPGRWLALMADPETPPGATLLHDTTVASQDRASLARAILPAFCLNAREVAFGVDPRRRQLLHGADAALGASATSSTRQQLEQWLETPADAGRSYVEELPPQFAPLRWAGLSGLRARLAYCRATI